MPGRRDIQTILETANAERSADKARRLLNGALAACHELRNQGDVLGEALLCSRTLALLALEENDPIAREKRWVEALGLLSSYHNLEWDTDAIELFSQLAVDFSQDAFIAISDEDKRRHLKKAQLLIENALGYPTLRRDEKALLLARQSSVLRHIAQLQITKQNEISLLSKSLTIARKAVENSENRSTLTELALAVWASARHEDNDSSYKNSLSEAESILMNDALRDFLPARLALSRLYRMTFRPEPACQVYRSLIQDGLSIRPILRESYIYAEAAISLWYSEYDTSMYEPYLAEAQQLLEQALAADFDDVRLITSLAFTKAILDGVDSGVVVLQQLGNAEQKGLWRELLTDSRIRPSQPENLGIVLGIGDSAILTRLGTFASDFLDNEQLAENLFRAAVSMNPRDPIALTNLARFLILNRSDSPSSEGERLLQRAEAFSDRRFIWWRRVKARLLSGRTGRAPSVLVGGQREASTNPVTDITDLASAYNELRISRNPQRRGYDLEMLIYRLAALTLGVEAKPSYRINRKGYKSQIDGFIAEGQRSYRIECKWEKNPAQPKDILAFADRLDVAGVAGLFVSIGGFTAEAVQKAKEVSKKHIVLLVDKQEVDALFDQRVHFDELLRAKRSWMDYRSEPYFKVLG
jgi:hypothetical protein